MSRQRKLSCRIDVVRPEIAGATDESLLTHIGLNDTWMNRVHPDAVAFAGELERGRFGEQGDATLGHRIKRGELRSYQTSDGSEKDDPHAGSSSRVLATKAPRARCREKLRLGPRRRGGAIRRGSRPRCPSRGTC